MQRQCPSLIDLEQVEVSVRTHFYICSESSHFATLHVCGRVCLAHHEPLLQKLLLDVGYGFQTLWVPELLCLAPS